ncbi:MAG: four helix bundle protein [Bacteroidota bacterium]
MDKYELQNRTKKLAISVIMLTKKIPLSQEGKVISSQIIRSVTSVAANYRAACRGKSPKDFISKMGIVEEECDETIFWLEIIEELQMVSEIEELITLKKEANEILSITVASIKTVKNKL